MSEISRSNLNMEDKMLRIEHLFCACGGSIGSYNKGRNYTCNKCKKEYLLRELEYDTLLINDKTGWLFPVIHIERKVISREDAINNISDFAVGTNQEVSNLSLAQAISDMEKLEKIEKAIHDIERLEKLMIDMFEEWGCFREHSYFEKLGIGIFSEGMQTVGYILDCLRGVE